MHPTLAGFYPFLLGSPARCAFLSYLCLYICLGSVTTPFLLLLSYLFRRRTFTFVYFFQWTMLLHCSLFWLNNRTMHLHCSLLLIVQRLDRTMVYYCSLVLNFHCLYKYINSSSLLQLVFNKDLYQINELKTIPLATKALFSFEWTWTTG